MIFVLITKKEVSGSGTQNVRKENRKDERDEPIRARLRSSDQRLRRRPPTRQRSELTTF